MIQPEEVQRTGSIEGSTTDNALCTDTEDINTSAPAFFKSVFFEFGRVFEYFYRYNYLPILSHSST